MPDSLCRPNWRFPMHTSLLEVGYCFCHLSENWLLMNKHGILALPTIFLLPYPVFRFCILKAVIVLDNLCKCIIILLLLSSSCSWGIKRSLPSSFHRMFLDLCFFAAVGSFTGSCDLGFPCGLKGTKVSPQPRLKPVLNILQLLGKVALPASPKHCQGLLIKIFHKSCCVKSWWGGQSWPLIG